MEKIVWDNRALRLLPIDSENRNFIRQVSRACFSMVVPTPLSRPKVVVYSRSALRLIGITDLPDDPEKVDKNVLSELARYFSGNERFGGSQPYSHCYAGHQFGSFAGQLGDGAAISLGEVVVPIPPSEMPLILDGYKFPTSCEDSSFSQQQQQQQLQTCEEFDLEAANAIVSTSILGCEGTLLQPENAANSSATVSSDRPLRHQQQQLDTKHVSFASTNEKRRREKAQSERLEANRRGNSVYLSTPHARWEVQIKGAGLTPFSRSGDGRKVLRSSLREFLCSEAMFALGIPTTRAGVLVVSAGDTVERDPMYTGKVITEPCAVCTRIAPNFIRFGSFEICKPAATNNDLEADDIGDDDDNDDDENRVQTSDKRETKKKGNIADVNGTKGGGDGDDDDDDEGHNSSSNIGSRAGPSADTGLDPILSLFEFTAQYYFPREWKQAEAERKHRLQAAMLGSTEPAVRAHAAPLVFRSIVRSTARLVAQWQCAGFVHGVLNTDNMSVLGLTIDYGPFQFMENFDKELTSNASDHTGRYCYENQPSVCKWNCVKLLESFRLMFPETILETPPKEIQEWIKHKKEEYKKKLKTSDSQNLKKFTSTTAASTTTTSTASPAPSLIRDFKKQDMEWVSYYFDESYQVERRNILRAKLFGLLPERTITVATTTATRLQEKQEQQQQQQQRERSTKQEEIDERDREVAWKKAVDEVDELLFETLQETSADFPKIFPIIEKLQSQMVVALTHYVTAITASPNDPPEKAANLLKKMQATTEDVLQRLSKQLGATGLGKGKICAPAHVRIQQLQRRAFGLRPRTPLSAVQQLLAVSDAELRQMFPQAPPRVIRREFQLLAEQGQRFLRIQQHVKEMQQKFGGTAEAQSSSATTAMLEKENTAKWLSFLRFFETRLRECWLRSLPQHFTPSMLSAEKDRREHALSLSNPRIVLRNWIAQRAIDAADKGDFLFVHKLLERLENPFVDPKKERERKEKRAKEREAQRLRQQKEGIFFVAAPTTTSKTSASTENDKNSNNVKTSESAISTATNLQPLLTLSFSQHDDEIDEDEDDEAADPFLWPPADAHLICVSCSS